jgi:hypothetical protein
MMTYHIPLGSSDETLDLQPTIWGPCRLSYKDELKALTWISGKLRVQAEDGQGYEVRYRPRFIDSLPTVLVNDVEVNYAPPLAWWMYVIAGMTVIPVLMSIGIWKVVFQDAFSLLSAEDLSLVLCTALPFPILPGLLIIYFGPRVIRGTAPRRYLMPLFIMLVVVYFLLSAACSFTMAILTGA